jgi:hypothetical protein
LSVRVSLLGTPELQRQFITPYIPSGAGREAAFNINDIRDWNSSLPAVQHGKNSYLFQALQGLAFGSSVI